MNTKEIIDWFEIKYPSSLIFTTEYGIFIPAPRLGRSGLWIEEHTGSSVQNLRIDNMRKMGYTVIVAEGCDSATKAIDDYMSEPTYFNYG